MSFIFSTTLSSRHDSLADRALRLTNKHLAIAIVALLTFVVAFVVGAAAFVALTIRASVAEAVRTLPPPPLEYTQHSYVPSGGSVACPGDAVTWRATLNVVVPPDKDAIKLTTEVFLWDVARHKSSIGRVTDEGSISIPETTVYVAENRYTVPPSTKAGDYILTRHTHGNGTDEAIYKVYFTVPADCGSEQ